MYGEREALQWWLHPLCMTQHESQLSLHRCLAFLQGHSLPWSPHSCPLGPSPHSQQQSSPWDYSPIPMFLLLATTLTRGPVSLFGVPRAVVQIVWFSLYSDHHRSAASLSQQPQMPTLCPKLLLCCWDLTPVFVPPPPDADPVPLTLLFFHSFLHLNEFCMDLYIPF